MQRLALVLLYNREQRYDEALTQLATLRAQYPAQSSAVARIRRDAAPWRKASLRPSGSSTRALRVSRPMTVRACLAKRRSGTHKRGAARTALGRAADAEVDLRKAVGLQEGNGCTDGRIWSSAGSCCKPASPLQRFQSFRTAISLCEEDGDPLAAAEAPLVAP